MSEPTDPVTVLKWTGDAAGTGGLPGIPATDLTDYDVRMLVGRDPRWNRNGPFTKVSVKSEGGVTFDHFEELSDREVKDAERKFTDELLGSKLYSRPGKADKEP